MGAPNYGGVAGWEFVHICIDDATRLPHVEVLTDEKATPRIGFLKRAQRVIALRRRAAARASLAAWPSPALHVIEVRRS